MTKEYKPRRRPRFKLSGSDRIYDPKDGVSVNQIKWGWSVSSFAGQMSLHDNPNLYQRTSAGNHRSLGIMKLIGKTNRYKSLNLNGQVGRMNKRLYNVR